MAKLKITQLRCEYHTNPLGIGVTQPRLSWQLQGDRRGVRQAAYQVTVAENEADLQNGRAHLWDSGQVKSDQSIHVVYKGKLLQSCQRVWWQVRVWDDERNEALSRPAWWEMGLLAREEWLGQWIGSTLVGGPKTTSPCPYLRHTFTLDQPVAQARLYVTALGLYEASLNGRPVSEDVFTPGWTDYNKRTQYQVYDVGQLLQEGENVIGAILGDGWYCGYIAWQGRQVYGDRPRFLAQLHISLTDGRTLTIITDENWRTAAGPLLESDLIMGESYDARRELFGWDAPGFDDEAWQPVKTFSDPGIELAAMRGQAVRCIEELKPIAPPREIPDWSNPKWIFDLGQNMVGRVRLQVEGKAGNTISLRFAEMLDADGNLYTENLRTARQTDVYTLRGNGLEVYEPHFTFHGFRYVELVGFPGTPTQDSITGIVLHSDTSPTGTFECSEPLLNQLQHNIVWGQKGNFLEVPTDCPQRDERLGWTGDAQVFIRTAAFNMDVASFFTKWQQDLADAQSAQGEFPPVAPLTAIGDPDGGPAWADAGVICPWTIYLCYGDTQLLAQHYESLTRFIDFLMRTAPDLIRCYPDYEGRHGYGDWLNIDAETPKDLIGTAFFAYSTYLLSQIAAALGKKDEARRYGRLFHVIRHAFEQRFVTSDGLLVGNTQTAYVLALHFDLLPQHLRATAVTELVRDIKKRGLHLSTGFVGSPYLPHVLSDNGRLDIAYELLLQKSWPSWLYSVTQGATTIWERWDGWTEDKGFQTPKMNSFNHYAYGAIGAWLYRVAAGIDADLEQPGYKQIILHPQPGGGLTYVKASYESMYGRILSHWHLEKDTFIWEITIPPNTTATVTVPASETAVVTEGEEPAEKAVGVEWVTRTETAVTYTVQSGSYRFEVT